MKPLILFSKIAFSIVLIVIISLLYNNFQAQDLILQIFVFIVLVLGLFISIKEKEKEANQAALSEELDQVEIDAENLIDMINHSKNIEEFAKSFIGQQTIKPYEFSGFMEWVKGVPEDEQGYYWGNCIKKEINSEIAALRKFKPRMVERFEVGTTAYDIHGNTQEELLPIYFTVKKEKLGV